MTNAVINGESPYMNVVTVSARSPGETSAAALARHSVLETIPENDSDPMSAVGTKTTSNGVYRAKNGIVRKVHARTMYTMVPERVLLFDSSGTGPTLQNDEISADIILQQDVTSEIPSRSHIQYASVNCSRVLSLSTLRTFDTVNILSAIEGQMIVIGQMLESYGGELPLFTHSYESELAAMSIRLYKESVKDREKIAEDAVAAANEASAAKAKGQIPKKASDGPTRAEDNQEKEAGCFTKFGYFFMGIFGNM